MKKKVLFIDYILEKGHVNFNHIHIDALKRNGFDVYLILHQYIADLLPYDTNQYVAIIPPFLRKREGHPLLNRIIFLLTLIYLRLKVRFKNYDHVIISSLDEISLGIFPLCQGMQIICHRNAISLENSIKRYFLKRLALHNNFIVFNESMVRPFHLHGITNVHIISHGVMPTYDNWASLKKGKHPIRIFHPSANSDVVFLKELLNSQDFIDYLRQEDIVLTLRTNYDFNSPTNHIKIIREFLSEEEYHKQFCNSDIILIIYPPTFRYTVSAVSFECITYGKKALIKSNEALDYCQRFYNYDPFFDSLPQLKERLTYIIHHPEAQCNTLPSDLAPDYTSIFK